MIDKSKEKIIMALDVYYVHHDSGEIRAAVINFVPKEGDNGEVNITIFSATRDKDNVMERKDNVKYSSKKEKGTWHWPDQDSENHLCDESVVKPEAEQAKSE